jgi:nucleoid DNA-binding protein
MKNEKINNREFVKQISKETGYAQADIKAVLESATDIVVKNLGEDKATAVFKGLIVYPCHYKQGELIYPRARFGKCMRP